MTKQNKQPITGGEYGSQMVEWGGRWWSLYDDDRICLDDGRPCAVYYRLDFTRHGVTEERLTVGNDGLAFKD